MSSPRTRSLLGRPGKSGTVHVIDTHVSKSYRQKALIAFTTTTFVVGLLAAVVISHDLHPVVGLILGLLLGAVCGVAVGALVAVWPILRVLVHWSVELVLAAGVLAGWMTLMQTTPAAISLLALAVAVGIPAVIGRTRRLAIAWWWCLAVRHRLRLYFAHHSGNSMVRSGSRPLILWATPTPAGERVWVWLRPGLSLKDLEAEGQMARLAVDCWAAEARVTRASRSYAGLLRFDITRRDPLTGTVISPLPVLVPDTPPTAASAAAGMPPVGLDLPDVPEETATPTPPRRTRRGDGDRDATPDWVDTNYDYA